jgi:HAD superfamily hydrolase (TIGR01490 family)
MSRDGLDLFDVDHTITRHSTGGRFVMRAIARGLVPWRYAAILPWYGVAYRLGVLRLSDREDAVPYLRGVPRDDLEALAAETFREHVRGDVNPTVERLIHDHIAAGRRVVLATSSIDLIVAPLAAHLGVRDVIATKLEFAAGRATGRIAGRALFRGEKQRTVLAFIRAAGVDARHCSFHSDSIYDLPLLEDVGEPVAVNPDFRLRRIAVTRGWPIIDSR